MKKIVVGTDFAGFDLKESVVEHLKELGYEVTDLGTTDKDIPVDYFIVGDRVGQAVADGDFERGILFCGSGMGVNLMANKYPNVLCGLCESLYAVNRARVINNINILAMGGFFTGAHLACKMVDEFLNTEWKAGEPQDLQDLFQKGYDYTISRAKEIRPVV